MLVFCATLVAQADNGSNAAPPADFKLPPGYIPPPGYQPPNYSADGQSLPGTAGDENSYGSDMVRKRGGSQRPTVVGKGYIKVSYTATDAVSTGAADQDGEPRLQQRVHVVEPGDCLWFLSRQFLTDPFRWREIWKRNRYIVDPDLIYPGNRIVLGEQMDASPPLDSSFLKHGPRNFDDATVGFLDDTVEVNQDSIDLARKEQEELELLNKIVRKKVLTRRFLARTPFLWMRKDANGLVYPGDARIDPRSEIEAFQLFDEIPISLIAGGTYGVGDTVDVFRSERMLTYKERKANLVRRIARGRITRVEDKKAQAVLFAVWDIVKPGDRVGRTERFPRYAVVDYVEPAQGIRGQVFERVEQSLFPYLYHSFIIDRGSSDGVQMGDLFVAYDQRNDEPGKPVQMACAVHVGENFATLATVKLYEKTLQAGDFVSLVKRMRKE